MSKVKLDLKNKSDTDLRTFATEHKAALVGNAAFPTPAPTPAVFETSLTEYAGKLDAIAATETTLETLRAQKEAKRAALEADLTARAAYVELTSGGDAAKILSAGFEVRGTPTLTSSLPAPTNTVAAMAENAGQILVTCNAVPKAKSYIVEAREHSETAAPGPWQHAKVSVRCSALLSGLVSGKKYAFRMRALGPNDLESPWSDETVCMAP